MIDRINLEFFRRGWRGGDRLWQARGRSGRLIVGRTSYGQKMRLDPHSYIDRKILRYAFYEKQVFEALRSILQSGDVFWDVGANIGVQSVAVAANIEGVSVICFEPSISVIERLKNNMKLNRLSAEIHPLALSDANGVQALAISSDGNTGMSTLNPFDDFSSNYVSKSIVGIASVDSLLRDRLVAPPNVMKIDVEGHELPILRGMANALRDSSLKSIVFEDGADQNSEAKSIMRKHGFVIVELDRESHEEHDLKNFVAVR